MTAGGTAFGRNVSRFVLLLSLKRGGRSQVKSTDMRKLWIFVLVW